jgi:DTW domain-containing protein YfiP
LRLPGSAPGSRIFQLMRSVVRKPSVRCLSCLLPPRWCVCAAQPELQSPLSIAVLSHQREFGKPSSTGNLIKRLLPTATQQRWDPALPVTETQISQPGRELWILHPQGEPMPADRSAEAVHVLLLDGSWSEATAMVRRTSQWGRLINLPMQGSSRFWLRAQQNDGRFSTMEALLFLLQALDQAELARELRLQFELHVYAGLRARGSNIAAAQYLADSPIRTGLADFLAGLHTPRPLVLQEEPQ